jgi:hypothetical protein
MIVRAWRAWALKAKAHIYAEHFRQNVVPELCRIPGFLGASLLRDERPDGVAYLVLGFA